MCCPIILFIERSTNMANTELNNIFEHSDYKFLNKFIELRQDKRARYGDK